MDSFQVFGSQLTGTLPDARSGWVSIRYFTIENTPMGGSVPVSRGVWTNLDELKIQNTYIHGVFDDAFAFDV